MQHVGPENGMELGEDLTRIRRRMWRIFLCALFLNALVVVLLILTRAQGSGLGGPRAPLVSILLWSLVVTAYAFHLLRTFAGRTAVQLARKQFLDPLTQAHNYLSIRQRLQEEEERVKRYGGKAAVLYMDLDGFKAVNDAHGHHIGNVVLREIVDALSGGIRQCDCLGRIGGDEFLVLLPSTGVAEAKHLADRLCKRVEGYSLALDHGAIIDFVRVSIGVGAYPETGDCMDCVVAGADKALYQVKKRGGNGVAAAGPYEPVPPEAMAFSPAS